MRRTFIVRRVDRASTPALHNAVNLGWKLAQVVKQRSPECLLDTYQPRSIRSLPACVQHDARIALLRQGDRTTAGETSGHFEAKSEAGMARTLRAVAGNAFYAYAW